MDTGFLAAMSSTCSLEIQKGSGIKNALFGGEELFNTVIRGPGHIILQTMPVSDVAKTIQPFIAGDTQH